MERFLKKNLSNVISDRMPRVSDVYRAQGAPYEQYQPNLAYIRNNPNLAYMGIGGSMQLICSGRPRLCLPGTKKTCACYHKTSLEQIV